MNCFQCKLILKEQDAIEMRDELYCETCAQIYGTQCEKCLSYYFNHDGFDYGHEEMCDNCCDLAADKLQDKD